MVGRRPQNDTQHPAPFQYQPAACLAHENARPPQEAGRQDSRPVVSQPLNLPNGLGIPIRHAWCHSIRGRRDRHADGHRYLRGRHQRRRGRIFVVTGNVSARVRCGDVRCRDLRSRVARSIAGSNRCRSRPGCLWSNSTAVCHRLLAPRILSLIRRLRNVLCHSPVSRDRNLNGTKLRLRCSAGAVATGLNRCRRIGRSERRRVDRRCRSVAVATCVWSGKAAAAVASSVSVSPAASVAPCAGIQQRERKEAARLRGGSGADRNHEGEQLDAE